MYDPCQLVIPCSGEATVISYSYHQYVVLGSAALPVLENVKNYTFFIEKGIILLY